jgi:hypothetical protein
MSTSDTVARDDTASALPADVAALLQQPPTAANVAQVHERLFESRGAVDFWRAASEKDLTAVGFWAFKNKAHAFGVPAMMLAALAAAGTVSVLFWGKSEASLLLKCVEVLGIFVLGYVAVFNLLYIPLSPLWNGLFGCVRVSRIIRCLRPVPPVKMLEHCVMPGADVPTRAAVTKYLEDVQARRPFVVQDIRVAMRIAADALPGKE